MCGDRPMQSAQAGNLPLIENLAGAAAVTKHGDTFTSEFISLVVDRPDVLDSCRVSKIDRLGYGVIGVVLEGSLLA